MIHIIPTNKKEKRIERVKYDKGLTRCEKKIVEKDD